MEGVKRCGRVRACTWHVWVREMVVTNGQVPGRERVRGHVRQLVQGTCANVLHEGAGDAAYHESQL